MGTCAPDPGLFGDEMRDEVRFWGRVGAMGTKAPLQGSFFPRDRHDKTCCGRAQIIHHHHADTSHREPHKGIHDNAPLSSAPGPHSRFAANLLNVCTGIAAWSKKPVGHLPRWHTMAVWAKAREETLFTVVGPAWGAPAIANHKPFRENGPSTLALKRPR